MALTKDTYVIGTQARFCRKGDTHGSAQTCGRTNKPVADDAAWIDLGVINNARDQHEAGDSLDVFAPMPGALHLYDRKRTKGTWKIMFQTKELSALVIQALYRTLALTSSSTQFNPGEGTVIQGWLKLQRYDETNTQRMLMDVWCELVLTSEVNFGGEQLAEADWEATVLFSTLNTGTL